MTGGLFGTPEPAVADYALRTLAGEAALFLRRWCNMHDSDGPARELDALLTRATADVSAQLQAAFDEATEEVTALRLQVQSLTRVDGTAHPSDSPTAGQNQPVPSYDDRQAGAVLTVCERCGKSPYMTKPQQPCVECR